jgi:hypothetical protein
MPSLHSKNQATNVVHPTWVPFRAADLTAASMNIVPKPARNAARLDGRQWGGRGRGGYGRGGGGTSRGAWQSYGWGWGYVSDGQTSTSAAHVTTKAPTANSTPPPSSPPAISSQPPISEQPEPSNEPAKDPTEGSSAPGNQPGEVVTVWFQSSIDTLQTHPIRHKIHPIRNKLHPAHHRIQRYPTPLTLTPYRRLIH